MSRKRHVETSSGSDKNDSQGAMFGIQLTQLWDFTDQWLDLAEQEETAALLKKEDTPKEPISDSHKASTEEMMEVKVGS